MLSSRKATILLLLGGGLVFADLWSKDWAERSLATPSHPIAIPIGEERDGKPLGEVLEERLGPLAPEARETLLREHLLRTHESARKKADDPVYDRGAPVSSRLYVFAHGDPTENPRLVIPTAHRTMRRWLRLQSPNASPQDIRQSLQEALGEETLTTLVAAHVPFLTEDTAAAIANGHVLALADNPRKMRVEDSWAPFQPDAPVRAGDIYLVTLHRVGVIDGFLRYTYAENPGAAWGFLSTAEPRFRQVFFLSVTGFVGLILLVFLIRLPPGNTLHIVTFATILGGAVGNLVDRIRYRYVVDFIDMYIGDSHWPTYNIADIAITVGLGLLVLDMLLHGKDSLLLNEDYMDGGREESA